METFADHFQQFHHVHGTNVQLDPTKTQATRVESFANGVCFSREPLSPGEIFLVEIEEKELGWCGHLRIGLTARDPLTLARVPEYSLPDLMDMGDSWVVAITRNHNRVVEEEALAPEREGAGEGGLAGGHRLGNGREEPGRRLPRLGGGDVEEEAINPKPKSFFTDSHLHIEQIQIPMDKLIGRSRPGRFSHILDDLYKTNALPPTARRSRIGVLYVPKGQDLADMHIVINGEDMGAAAKSIPVQQALYAVVDVYSATKQVRIVQVEYGFSSLQTLCRKCIQKNIVHRMALDWLELPERLKHYCKYE
ncbi:neuralized-like protein 2 [Esox lucius]|uniref:Neuralized E3 ubiquitin protein ligase 2 n=1 Tax=Esox lucius TaxID=8010 RepID=A0A3P8YRT8_ESOLU|nr:neuralized-like protein 2 [Esox lucius]